MRATGIKRANDALEDLLRHHSEALELDPQARGGEDAQRPSGSSPADTEEVEPQTFQGSAASSQRTHEPSLLGSGWSWQNPRDGRDLLHTSQYFNTVTSNDSEEPQVGGESKAANAMETARQTGRSNGGSPHVEELELAAERAPSEGQESRFSTDESESEDNWSNSSSQNNDKTFAQPSPRAIIGRGAFGSVYRATWKGQPAALKVLEHDDELGQEDHVGIDLDSDEELEDLEFRGTRRKGGIGVSGSSNQQSRSEGLTATQADLALMEAAMSSAVHHPNVVQTYHYRTLQPENGRGGNSGRITRETHIVMEYCDCGSLEDATTDGRLSDSSGADVDLELLSMTLLEVARAMEYLHKMHITHRDLKLANVLLKSAPSDARGFTSKVSDFGLSRLLPEHSPKMGSKAEYTGTITHMAPELLQHGAMSRAADVYSFGILMWEALMGEAAYIGISKMQVMFGVVSEGLRPVFPANTPPWYSQIASACWKQDSKRRPTFSRVAQRLEEALSHLRVR